MGKYIKIFLPNNIIFKIIRNCIFIFLIGNYFINFYQIFQFLNIKTIFGYRKI